MICLRCGHEAPPSPKGKHPFGGCVEFDQTRTEGLADKNIESLKHQALIRFRRRFPARPRNYTRER